MTWGRFGYICRKASIDCQEHETVAVCLRRIGNEKACNFYGKSEGGNSLPEKILNSLGLIQDKTAAQAAIKIYKSLDIAKSLEAPMALKRVIAYLGIVICIFYLVVGVYTIRVAPKMIESLSNMSIAIPNIVSLFQEYWILFVIVNSVFLVAALVIGLEIRRLFRFEVGVEDDLFLRYVFSRRVRDSYVRVSTILQYPIFDYLQNGKKIDGELISHLKSIDSLNMDVAKEMKVLIDVEMNALLCACERQMKVMSAIVAVFSIAAVFIFLLGAYLPLIHFGNTL